MGAIIGKLSFDPGETPARPVLERMLDACARRGEQQRGVFSAPGVALGWCFAADDETPTSMPGTNKRRSLYAVADSRLTNASQLRVSLERCRHEFSGTTDSELVARAYDEWGIRCFKRFRGPFACAIWDVARRRLVVARDQIGIQPLYFAVLRGHGVVFASDIRALLKDPGVGREWCPAAIDTYLTLGYVPAPLSAFRSISKLEPAHTLTVEGRRLHIGQYWDLPSPSVNSATCDAATALSDSLRAAIHAEAHGSGILYSGGAASTSLLAVAPPTEGIPITVGFEQDSSELTRSDRAAAHLGRTRELEFVRPAVGSVVTELAAHCGEPIADPAALTQFLIATAARRHAGVLFTGHGAAVLWGGRSCERRAEHDLWDGHHRRAIYTREFAWEVRNANPYQRHFELRAALATDDPIDRALYADARTYLPDAVMASAGPAARAAGVTLRFPFLDVPLVTLAATLPVSAKVHGHIGLQPLRARLARVLPASLLPPTQPAASQTWLRTALASLVPAVLLRLRFDRRGIVSRLSLSHLWDEHRAGTCDHSHRLWSLLMLEVWFRHFVDGDSSSEEPYEYALLKAA